MKFTSIVAIIGCASAFAEGDTTPVWGLRSITDHREEAQTQIHFANTATDRANARPPLRSHVQLESDSSSDSSDSDEEEDLVQVQGDSRADWKGKLARFMGDEDDKFMRSVIENYASEGVDADTKEPTGVWTLNENQSKALATEVLGTHKGIKGAALAAYFKSYWSKAWGHYDVNRTGAIPIMYAPQLMRFLMSDQYVQL